MATVQDPASAPADWAQSVVAADEEEGLLRRPRVRSGGSWPRCTVDGREVVVFSSNDYLGLSVHPAVRTAAADAALRRGVGATGSRHLSGGYEQLEELEDALTAFEGSEAATIAPSGYAANTAVLASLGGPDAVIFSDALNHASIVDGCRLSRSAVEVFEHLDLGGLEARLRESRSRRVIVSDTVFSTDGSCADVAGLMRLARRHDAWLVLDEAHATGVLGPGGRGAAAAVGVHHDERLVRVVTLSKALGAQGAAVCSSRAVRQLLLQRGRPLIFSTAPAHPVVAAAIAALGVLRNEPDLVDHLRSNARLMHALLGDTEGDSCADVPIAALVLGDAQRAVAAEKTLWEQGWMVNSLRPPTVPAGTSRLRLVVTALHTEPEIRGVCEAIRQIAA